MQFARQHGMANFGNERAALAAMLQQLAGLVLVACRFKLDDLDLDIGRDRGQAAGNFLGLGKRHHALARADANSNCHHSRSVRHRAENLG